MRKIIIPFIFSLFYNCLSAQSADTNLHSISIVQSIDNYKKAISKSIPIYNGIEHVGYPNFYEGVAYFDSKDWQKGTINYEGLDYADVYLKYDMVTDGIVIRNPVGFGLILFSPRVARFTISTHKFIYFPTNEQLPTIGFYQELVLGKMSLLAKKSKTINEDISSGKSIKKFDEKDAYYVLFDGKYYAIKNERSIYDLVGEKKKGIKNYLKEKKIKYKNDPEAALMNIASYYNGSTK